MDNLRNRSAPNMAPEEVDIICRVEPGTPMNAAFKRFWLVAGLSADHPEPDSTPKRSRMLSEDYILFRDSEGRMGCLRERCCHRGASLCLGRVEDGGIRCIFHGWKYAVDGTILDMPNAGGYQFKKIYKQPAFPVVEKGGMIWVYLGAVEEQPPLPNFRWLDFAPEQCVVTPVVYESNYTLAIDGGADSSHFAILHRDSCITPHAAADSNIYDKLLADVAPRFDTYETVFGQYSAAIRTVPGPQGEDTQSCRSSAFIVPATVLVAGTTADKGLFAFFMPVDTHRTIAYIGNFDVDWSKLEDGQNMVDFMGMGKANLDHLGFSREAADRTERANRANNWYQDRAAMKAGRFTGLAPFVPEDVIIAESIGMISSTDDHLIPADQVIVRIRRILLNMARDVDAGLAPVGLREPIDYSQILCQEKIIEEAKAWPDVMIPPQFLQQGTITS
jgi:phthalate 4,5-dioxygenase oxygenase subunit